MVFRVFYSQATIETKVPLLQSCTAIAVVTTQRSNFQVQFVLRKQTTLKYHQQSPEYLESPEINPVR